MLIGIWRSKGASLAAAASLLWLLVACGEIPDWLLEPARPTATLTPTVTATVGPTATPIDALTAGSAAAGSSVQTAVARAPVPTLAEQDTALPTPASTPANSEGSLTATPTLTVDPDERVAEAASWQGVIFRQPYGALVEYRLLSEDGTWYDLEAEGGFVRQQVAQAAWTAAEVIVNGQTTEQSSRIAVKGLLVHGPGSEDARDVTAFAMPSSSSYLPGDRGGFYHAWSAVDGVPTTAWCEAGDGPGIGEWLQLDFSTPVEFTALEVANGFNGLGNLFEVNGRVQSATILLDGVEYASWNLEDTHVPQSFPIFSEQSTPVSAASIRIVITGDYPGSVYDDTCISEVAVWGRVAETR